MGNIVVVILIVLAIIILPSIRVIGPTEIGLITKRFGFKRLSEDNPIAFNGEAGYQADLLMPGFRFKLWLLYKVEKFPWVQIHAGEIGVVIAQAGQPLPIGAKSAVFKPEFGDFSNLRDFVRAGGQKGVQRPVLSPGTLAPIHPVGFMVLTKHRIYGVPISRELATQVGRGRPLTLEHFGLAPERLNLTRIEPQHASASGEVMDVVGIVTTYEGDPLPMGDIASRLGGFQDMLDLERQGRTDSELMQAILNTKNGMHNNYQDFQAFLDNGGKIGLQHDPFPGECRDRADAGGQAGRGRGGEGVCRVADRGHVRRRVQVRHDRQTRPPRYLAGGAAHRQVPDQPALLPG
jgi:hypothetical protein